MLVNLQNLAYYLFNYHFFIFEYKRFECLFILFLNKLKLYDFMEFTKYGSHKIINFDLKLAAINTFE